MKLSPVLLAAVSADQEFCQLFNSCALVWNFKTKRVLSDRILFDLNSGKRALLGHHLILISRIHGLSNVEMTTTVPQLLFKKLKVGIDSMLKVGCLKDDFSVLKFLFSVMFMFFSVIQF